MNRFTLLALASASAIAIATPAAAAPIITIGASTNGGATITTLATDNMIPGSASYAATVGQFFLNLGATGAPLLPSPNILTQSIEVRTSDVNTALPVTLSIFITEQGLTSFTGALTSSFTSNMMTGLSAASISSYYSAANALFAGTLLQSAPFASIGTYTGVNGVIAATPFSETIRYDLTFTPGNGTFNGTANLTGVSGPVPELATWGMMIAGFGLVGGVLRRRRATVSFA